MQDCMKCKHCDLYWMYCGPDNDEIPINICEKGNNTSKDYECKDYECKFSPSELLMHMSDGIGRTEVLEKYGIEIDFSKFENDRK